MDAADAVGDGHDGPLVARIGGNVEVLDLALQQFADFGGIELHSFLSWSFVQRLLHQRIGELRELAAHRGVEHLVTNANRDAADEFGDD